MDASLEERMLRLAQELAISHGTFFAAALLADVGVHFLVALAALSSQPCPEDGIGRDVRMLDRLSDGISPTSKPDALRGQAQQPDDRHFLNSK